MWHVALGALSAVQDHFDPELAPNLTESSLHKINGFCREDPLQSLSLIGCGDETDL